MTVPYTPGAPPDDTAQLIAFLRNELASIKSGLEQGWTSFTYVPLYAQPSRVFAGLTVYADGTTWNPGSGEGVYRRNLANTAWVFLG